MLQLLRSLLATKPGIRVLLLTAICSVLLVACTGGAQTSAPSLITATVAPGTLNPTTLDQYGLTLLTPSAWKAPVTVDNNSFIISPTGSTDTSIGASPFMYVVTDALRTFKAKITFRDNFTEPADQLDALMQAINRDGPHYEKILPYTTAKYPGAIIHGFERDNEIAIILLKADKGWLYIGLQTRERDFKFYDENVFKPVIDSITLK